MGEDGVGVGGAGGFLTSGSAGMTGPPWADAVRGVAGRAGLEPARITVEPLPEDGPGRPACAADFRADGGRLTLRATDPVAASVALGRYARTHLGTRLTWSRSRVSERRLPDAPRTSVSSPHAVRYYLNVVTFGYSTPFWGWDRWEREIDWMALHGVTHPLMLVAHEAVLAETFRRAGLPDAEAAEWIGGAAHFPWTFMGGMHSFGGPLPARWAERRVDLARRILVRMRELGMTPVLPGFGGHVPRALAGPGQGAGHGPGQESEQGPEQGQPVDEIEWQGWHIPLLHPESPRFQELHATFGAVQRELLGPGTGFYAVDPYIESVPPSGDVDYLRAAGRGTYRALAAAARAAAEPGPVWVLQGWPFHYKGAFWTPDRVAAYLHDVPADRTLVLDLWGEHVPLHAALLADGGPLAGRPWVWCALHNFGGRPALFGDLAGLVRDVHALPDGVAHLRGVGLAPEAIENNEVFYELATDLAWDDAPRSPADLDVWLESFVLTRYGLAGSSGLAGPAGLPAEPTRPTQRVEPAPPSEQAGMSGPAGTPGLIPDPVQGAAEAALRAWHTIYSTLYGAGRTRSIPTPVIARPWSAGLPFPAQRSAGEAISGPQPPTPSSNVDAENDPATAAALPRLAGAVQDLTAVHEALSRGPSDDRSGADPDGPATPRDVLAADIAELTGHVLAQGTRVHVRGILAAARAGDPDGVRDHMGRLRADLLTLDTLTAERPETRVSTWIDAARAWGDTTAERDAMEREARSLVSVWGGQHNGLHDYSGRHWHGLVRDLYLPRWRAWADWLADAATAGPVPPDADPTALRARIVAIEETWRSATTNHRQDGA
ncbi:alpha-N-acetylglucosaminidase TIM-barrel domain-containing protein [Promicromonospora sp. MEB111]|uniref:alpha-N-acetylglucosaminidase TIM-barrel domain-containing protein n=1 Tax=Promicromonospora sp. MEB111 TaxID=3040301 RepID=UPI00254A7BE2|nr:alpha-N-acetylglucosaminidase TIM-barrel domain-containing protein [Promicromonospora sp. MEB111]